LREKPPVLPILTPDSLFESERLLLEQRLSALFPQPLDVLGMNTPEKIGSFLPQCID
jgi:hypothetical protein